MTLQQLHAELQKLLYIEDMGMVDVILASIVANSIKLGDPVWLTLIGPSSGGKSQIIRPFAKANAELIHRVDDLTPNTFISGSLGIEGSLLGRIGKHAILSMDDLTVLFSKNVEARGEILSQFRMLYDGRFSKSSGNRKDEMIWEGYIGMISGSTPSIYRYFAEVADMGERFVSYRMKPFDKHKALDFITSNQMTSKSMDDKLAVVIGDFLSPLLADKVELYRHTVLSDEVKRLISDTAEHTSLLRTPVHIEDRSGFVDDFPEPEMPFRVMKQLTYLAQGMQALNGGPMTPDQIHSLRWVGWSLCNDKRRAYMKAMVTLDYQSKRITARNVSSIVGLHKDVVKKGLDQLQALHILQLKSEDKGEYEWLLMNRELRDFVMLIDPPDLVTKVIDYGE